MEITNQLRWTRWWEIFTKWS